jgi:CDP-diacylglycerol--serine O-phosphatidyltransferase
LEVTVARIRKLSLRRTLFVLPNLFSVGSSFCGFYSMMLAAQAQRPWDYWAAAWLIALGAILDGVDGRVARLTRTQSAFGLQLDSLSDAITFGVAPAWLVYHWGLSSMGIAGFAIAFVFAACTSIRLARFNVQAQQHSGGGFSYFTGLPSPIAAAILAGVVAVHAGYLERFGVAAGSQWAVALMTVALGGLMVSDIRFRSYKGLRMSPKVVASLLLTIAGTIAVASLTRVELALLAAGTGYVTFQLAASVVRFERRLARGRSVAAPVAVLAETEDEEPVADEAEDADDERPARV